MSWLFGPSKSRSSNNASPRRNNTNSPKNNNIKYNLRHLQQLYHDLAQLTLFHSNQTTVLRITNANRFQVVEILRAISELIVYGSQGDDGERIFDYFCEKNMLAIFTRMLNTPNVGPSIKRQIIQTMSILVQNISNDTYFYYLLSNNHINEIISHPFNLANEDILSYYVSFLKMLSLKLNEATVQFFFNRSNNSFPLFTEASKLVVHSENMIRTHIRNLILNVYSVSKHERNVREYLNVYGNDVLKRLAFWQRDQTNILGRYLQLYANNDNNSSSSDHSTTEYETNSSNNKSNDNTNKYNDRIKMMANDLLDEIYFVQDVFGTNIVEIQSHLIDIMLIHVYFPVLIDGLKNIHSNSSIVTQSKDSWGPDCCVDGDNKQPLQNNTYITTHHRPACGSLLSLYLLTQIFYVCKSKRLTSAIANSIISYNPIQIHDWLHHTAINTQPDGKGPSTASSTTAAIDTRVMKQHSVDIDYNDMNNVNKNNNNTGNSGTIDMLASFDRLRWQAPPPLRLGRGYAIDYAGGNKCLNCTRRVIFGNLLSGNDPHTLLTCLMLYSMYKCKYVNNSILRKADFLTANDFVNSADVKHIKLLGDRNGGRKHSSLFDDDDDGDDDNKDILGDTFDHAPFTALSPSKQTRGNSIFDDDDDDDKNMNVSGGGGTTLKQKNLQHATLAFLKRCEAKMRRVQNGLNQIENDTKANGEALSLLQHSVDAITTANAKDPNSSDNAKKAESDKPIDVINYPKGLTGVLLSAMNNFLSSNINNSQQLGTVRIITIRTIVKLLKYIINNNNQLDIDNDDLTYEQQQSSHLNNNITMLGRDLITIDSIYENSRICIQSVLETYGTLQRPKNIFIDIFEAEIKRMKDFLPLPLNLLSGKMLLLLLPIKTGANSGLDLEYRLPHGEGEFIRWSVRLFLLARELKYFCNNETDKDMNEIVTRIGGSNRDSNRSNLETDILNGDSGNKPTWLQETYRVNGGGGSNQSNTANFDIGLYEHVSCRLPLSSMNKSNDNINNATGNKNKNVFLCSVTNKIAIIAVEQFQKTTTDDDHPTMYHHGNNDNDDTVSSSTKYHVTSLQYLESVTMDHKDKRVLRISFRAKNCSVKGARRGSIDSSGNGPLWHLTIGFETVEASNWSKAKLEKILVDTKLNKMDMVMALLKLDDLPTRPVLAPGVPEKPDRDGDIIGSPKRTATGISNENCGNVRLKALTQTPTKLKQLNRLKLMGFTEEEHDLTNLLEKYNDSIEGVLGELLN